jgi:chromosome segregation ATPase
LNSDKKFKPDKLAPLCARLDTDGEQLDKQKEEKEKAVKIIDDASDDIESRTKKIATQHEEIKRLADELAEIEPEGDLKGDDAVKIITKTANVYAEKVDEIAAAAQAITKSSNEVSALVKKMAAQFKAKREAIDAAIKKTQTDGNKAQGDIKKQIGVYQKIATDMKDRDMASDIGSLGSIVAQLYVFS